MVNPAAGTTFHDETSTPRTVASHVVAEPDGVRDAVAAGGAGDGGPGPDLPPDEHAARANGTTVTTPTMVRLDIIADAPPP